MRTYQICTKAIRCLPTGDEVSGTALHAEANLSAGFAFQDCYGHLEAPEPKEVEEDL